MSKPQALPPTPSQTVGPFFTLGLIPDADESGLGPLISNEIRGAGDPVTISGMVFDGAGKPVEDAMIEIAQADGAGGLGRNDCTGFARAHTGDDGSFTFRTVRPGALREGEAPYISLAVFMRGTLRHVLTRIYFAGEEANADDPVFSRLPEERRDTLLARRVEHDDHTVYQFDINMQGDRETVFFQPADASR